MKEHGWTRAEVDAMTLTDLVLLTNAKAPPPAGVTRLTTAPEVIAEIERRQRERGAWV
jgi:hypothetical protein